MKGNRVRVIIVVFLVLFGIFDWNYIVTSPQYSLYRMAQAEKARDYAKFQYYVDVDALSNNLTTRAMNQSEKYIPQQSGGLWMQVGAQFAQNLLTTLKPKLKSVFKRSIQTAVQTGQANYLTPKIDNLTTAMTKIKADVHGDTATATVPTDDNKQVQVQMRKVDRHWQIYDMNIDPQRIDTTQGL